MIQKLQQDPQPYPGYSWHNEELLYKGHVYLRKQSNLKSMVLSELHASPTTQNSRFTKTYGWFKHSLFWDGMKHDICIYVAECDTCQHNIGENIKYPGTLQPLLILPSIWRDIYVDFIVELPKSGNKAIIMVVVYRLSKYAHLCALQHPFTTSIVDQFFMYNKFKLHGMPHSIVFDQN
jgi:hypothetical protein